jgi:hypothetical protein
MLRRITRFVLAVVGAGMLGLAPMLWIEPDSGEVAFATARRMQNPTPENEKALAEARHRVKVRTKIVRMVWVFAVIGLGCGVYLLRPARALA